MKKIIALAVASAFAAPVFAADVTVGGDVEYKFQKLKGEGVSGSVGDQDIIITATEEVDGMTIGALVNNENATVTGAAFVSGAFGKIEIGSDVDHAINQLDEVAVVAESGLGAATPSLGGTADAAKIAYTFPTLAEGLVIKASFGAAVVTNDDDSGTESQSQSIAASYSMAGFKLVYGRGATDDELADVQYTSVSYKTGPFFVAYDMSTNDGGENDVDNSAVGVTYNYGPGKVFYEAETNDLADGTSTSNTAFGVSYKIGSLNTYVELGSGDTENTKGTTVGVEYSF